MQRSIVVAAVAGLVFALVGVAGAQGPAAKADQGKRTVRYKGQSKSGQQPIRFRVVTKGNRGQIKGLAVDVVTQCWADENNDGVQDQVTAHIRGLHGKLSRSGEVDVYYAPDDDTEYVVEGTLKKGTASLNVIVSGAFSPDGVPNGGDLQCDNWGARYRARPGR